MGAAKKNDNAIEVVDVTAQAASQIAASNHREGAFSELSQQLEKKVDGRRDSLRNTILSFVARDKFDIAVRELKYYQQFLSDNGTFAERTDRYFEHCEELILAIKAKKSFPNVDSLPMAKRQELFERIQEHFDDLQEHLKRIEQIENDIKVQDARSTVWVIQAFVASAFVVTIFTVVHEALKNMGMSFNVVFDDFLKLLYKLVGL